MALHEPDLQQMLAHQILRLELKDFVHEGDLVRDRLLLQKDEPQVAGLAQAGEGGLVKIAVLGAHPAEHVFDKGGIDFLVDLMGFD
jgi:hypothetical protein